MRIFTLLIACSWSLTESLVVTHKSTFSQSETSDASDVLLASVSEATKSKKTTLPDIQYPSGSAMQYSAELKRTATALKTQTERHKISSGQDPGDSEHESFFDRMSDAITEFCVGIVLLMFSVPIMWFNERRQARMESLLSVGQSECVSVTAAKDDHRGELVHVTGGEARGVAAVACNHFNDVGFPSGCLRLRTVVEVYQWQETEKTENRKDNFGGGQTKVTTYSHAMKWTRQKVNSSEFKREAGHVNVHPVDPGEFDVNCKKVLYGEDAALDESPEAFAVPPGLLNQLTSFESMHDKLPDNVLPKGKTLERPFVKRGSYFMYEQGTITTPVEDASSSTTTTPAEDASSTTTTATTTIGDVRVVFEAIMDGEKTIMALQCEGDKTADKDTFLPYRMIYRGFCCWGPSSQELKRRLKDEALKSPSELADQDKCSCGPLNCCCCCCLIVCNLVNCCCSGLFTPQIYNIYDGKKTPGECMSHIANQSKTITWVIRFIGWLMMFIGTCALFAPLLLIPELIPFLGQYIAQFAGAVIAFLAFFVTLFICMLIISLAYLVYRPCLGIFYILVTGIIAAVPIAISMGMIAVPGSS